MKIKNIRGTWTIVDVFFVQFLGGVALESIVLRVFYVSGKWTISNDSYFSGGINMQDVYTDEIQIDERINKQTIVELFIQEQEKENISEFLDECKQSGVLKIIKD